MHQFGVRLTGQRGDLVEHRIGRFRLVAETLHVEQRRLQSRRHQTLQIPLRRLRFGVLGRDHLTLLGEAQRTLYRAGRLREDGLVAGSAAAPDGAAATMEEPQPNSGFPSHFDQRQLGSIDRPIRGEVSTVLVGVGVAEHHFLAVAPSRHQCPIDREFQHRVQYLRTVVQVVDRLEQRGNTDGAIGFGSGDIQQPGLFEQDRGL
ncbi:hypothetical protein ATCCBAA256_06290 [Mycobacterium montefiorense]|nr:hypothetical protein ATCCBAA256_06290 [Mycobacterium montefiorense]